MKFTWLLFAATASLSAATFALPAAGQGGYGSGGYVGAPSGVLDTKQETPEERRMRFLKLAGTYKEKSETVLAEAEAKAAEYRSEAAAARAKAEADAAANPNKGDSIRAKGEKNAARLEQKALSALEKAAAKSESYKKKSDEYLAKAAGG